MGAMWDAAPAGPVPCLGRAVTRSGIASHCPSLHTACLPPPGTPRPGRVLRSAVFWASKIFPAGPWIVTRKGGFAFSCPRGRPPSLHCCQAAGSPPLSRSPSQASAPRHHPGCLPGSGVGVITSLYSQTCPQESSQSSGSKCNQTLGNHPFRWGLD